jgi:hypothetical protein
MKLKRLELSAPPHGKGLPYPVPTNPPEMVDPVAVNDAIPAIVSGTIRSRGTSRPVLWRSKGDLYVPHPLPITGFMAGSVEITGLTDPNGFAMEGVVIGYGIKPDGNQRGFYYQLKVGSTDSSDHTNYADRGPFEVGTAVQTMVNGELTSVGSSRLFAADDQGATIMVGMSNVVGGTVHAAAFQLSTFLEDLGTLGEANSSAATAMVDEAAVGWSSTSSGTRRATFFKNLVRPFPTLQDLGSLGGPNSEVNAAAAGFGLNAPKYIVGWADGTDGISHPCRFYLFANQPVAISPKRGQALGVNRHGVAVGWTASSDAVLSAFMQTENGPLVDLTKLANKQKKDAPFTPPLHLEIGRAINDRGEILVLGQDKHGPAAFLMIPD